jgi:membrane associated rhomboid family serine protease
MIDDNLHPRLTPWVLRLLAANAIVLLLQQTLITSGAFWGEFVFDPDTAFRKPWTFLSYMFLHGGLLHLLGNSLGLFVFGPPVERRMGSSRFIAFYLFCGLGGAVLSLLLVNVMSIGPMVGASGAVLGLAVAFARFHPDATLVLFPIPLPIKAKHLVMILAGAAALGALAGSSGIAHVAHLGGLLFGLLYFAARGIATRDEAPRFPEFRPRVPVGVARRDPVASAERTSTQPAARPKPGPTAPDPGAIEAAELDRILDKISAQGISALLPEERAFLDKVAERRKDKH